MINLRKYGIAPFKIAVIHGGPGAPGSMAPLARELSLNNGVLEPLQTAKTLNGQIQELRHTLEKNGDPPIILIGFSWGAILSFIYAAQYPNNIKKLILVSSGVFQEEYAVNIMQTRLDRLDRIKKDLAYSLIEIMNKDDIKDKNNIMERFGKLMTEADAYDPLTLETEVIECQYDIFKNVWNEAKKLRINGKLLKMGKLIKCPVIAIHGEYDPHPPEGIKNPLSSLLMNFKFILLKNCGHIPWIEKNAKEKFFELIKKEISNKF